MAEDIQETIAQARKLAASLTEDATHIGDRLRCIDTTIPLTPHEQRLIADFNDPAWLNILPKRLEGLVKQTEGLSPDNPKLAALHKEIADLSVALREADKNARHLMLEIENILMRADTSKTRTQ